MMDLCQLETTKGMQRLPLTSSHSFPSVCQVPGEVQDGGSATGKNLHHHGAYDPAGKTVAEGTVTQTYSRIGGTKKEKDQ